MGNQPSPALDAPECFAVMPITDPDGYVPGHFQRVFEDLVVPACAYAGYRAVRADHIRETNLIHLDILQRLLESPMVICDLSSRNPNVLFELGLRQAFDRPVVLVQETGTPKIFDIAPLRITEYRRERLYHEVLEDQRRIADAVTATQASFAKNTGVNSIVRILSLTRPASVPELQEANRDPALQLVRAELSELRSDIRALAGRATPVRHRDNDEWNIAYVSALMLKLEKLISRAKARQTIDAELAADILAEKRWLYEAITRGEERSMTPLRNDLLIRLRNIRQDLGEIEQRLVPIPDGTPG